jgi:hypothetical protein
VQGRRRVRKRHVRYQIPDVSGSAMSLGMVEPESAYPCPSGHGGFGHVRYQVPDVAVTAMAAATLAVDGR